MNIEQAVKFPFKYSNWEKTFGVYFLISMFLIFFNLIIQALFEIPTDILNTALRENVSETLQTITVGVSFTSLILGSIVLIFSLPFNLYLNGYTLDIVRHIIYGKEPSITPHGNFIFRVKLGFVRFIIRTIVSLATLLPISIFIILFFILTVISRSSPLFLAIGIIVLILLAILWFIMAIFTYRFFTYAMEYKYLTSGFRSMFNISELFTIIKKNISNFLVLIGVEITINIIIGFSMFAFCLIFFLHPLILSIGAFSLSYLYGETFKKIRAKSGV